MKYNKKTALVCFLSGNITRVVSLSHDTNESILRPFLARIVANLIQKFKTQSSAVTSQMTRSGKILHGWIARLKTANFL
jgi:hypothetical protein